MNIFALSDDPVLAARYQCDKHVVKMPLEAAQMLSSVWARYEPDHINPHYAPTHRNHPCTLWAGQTTGNYEWLVRHAIELIEEHHYRYPHSALHASLRVVDALREAPTGTPSGPLAPFTQCMPDLYRRPDPVIAYRLYYLGEKMSFARWTRRLPPYWVAEYESQFT